MNFKEAYKKLKQEKGKLGKEIIKYSGVYLKEYKNKINELGIYKVLNIEIYTNNYKLNDYIVGHSSIYEQFVEVHFKYDLEFIKKENLKKIM